MSKKHNKPYVPRHARDLKLLRSQGKVRSPLPDSTSRDLSAPTQEQTVLLPEKRINLDQAMIEFGDSIERRYQKASIYMDEVIKDARRIVFGGKERG